MMKKTEYIGCCVSLPVGFIHKMADVDKFDISYNDAISIFEINNLVPMGRYGSCGQD